MKDLYTMGKRDLLSFRNRLARLYGMGRIPKEDFETLDGKAEELFLLLEGLRARDEVVT